MPGHSYFPQPFVVRNPTKIEHFSSGLEACKEFLLNFGVHFHSNHTLSNQDKMYQLRSHLKGEAQDFISNFPPDGSQYEAALAALKEHFAPTNAVKHHYTGAIMRSKKVTSFKDLAAFNSLATRCVRHLESENVDPGALFLTLLVGKLSETIQLDMAKKLPAGTGLTDLDLKSFMALLQEETKLLRQTSYVNCYDNPNEDKGGAVTALTSTLGEATSLAATSSRRPPSGPSKRPTGPAKPCVYCSGSHSPNKCEQVPDPHTRYGLITQKQLCTVCLSPDHRRRTCPDVRKKACDVCKRGHHSSLHGFFRDFNRPSQ